MSGALWFAPPARVERLPIKKHIALHPAVFTCCNAPGLYSLLGLLWTILLKLAIHYMWRSSRLSTALLRAPLLYMSIPEQKHLLPSRYVYLMSLHNGQNDVQRFACLLSCNVLLSGMALQWIPLKFGTFIRPCGQTKKKLLYFILHPYAI